MEEIVWRTEKRKVDDLIPYESNPRKISPSQQVKLTESLQKFGLVEIPAINADNKIIAGHQRLAILKFLGRGQEEVEVRIPSRQLTETEFKQYLLTSNRVGGDWDWDNLFKFDKNILFNSGFDSKEIDKIFRGKENEDDNFNTSEEYHKISVPESKIGEVYQLGRHKVMCGDATNQQHVKKLMGGGIADMVFTDPLYNVDYHRGMNDTDQNLREGILNDKMSDSKFAEFLQLSLKNMLEYCNGVFYICMSSKEGWGLKNIFEQAGGHWQSFIIWAKNTFTLSRCDWQNQYEPILYGWNAKTKNHFFAGWRNEPNVWRGLEELNPSFDGKKTVIKIGGMHLELDGPITGKIINKEGETDIWNEKKPSRSPDHPTMKPIKLIAKALKASSSRDQIVMDLFGGSGSTLIAAEQTDRICYMMELDPKYVDVIRKRYTKLKAENK